MTISVVCIECGYTHQFDEAQAGSRTQCQSCAATVVIPSNSNDVGSAVELSEREELLPDTIFSGAGRKPNSDDDPQRDATQRPNKKRLPILCALLLGVGIFFAGLVWFIHKNDHNAEDGAAREASNDNIDRLSELDKARAREYLAKKAVADRNRKRRPGEPREYYADDAGLTGQPTKQRPDLPLTISPEALIQKVGAFYAGHQHIGCQSRILLHDYKGFRKAHESSQHPMQHEKLGPNQLWSKYDVIGEYLPTDVLAMAGLRVVLIPLLFSEDPAEKLLQDVTGSKYVQTTTIDGRPAYHVRFLLPEEDWEFWIQAEGDPLIRRFQITTPSFEGHEARGKEWRLVTESFTNWRVGFATADGLPRTNRTSSVESGSSNAAATSDGATATGVDDALSVTKASSGTGVWGSRWSDGGVFFYQAQDHDDGTTTVTVRGVETKDGKPVSNTLAAKWREDGVLSFGDRSFLKFNAQAATGCFFYAGFRDWLVVKLVKMDENDIHKVTNGDLIELEGRRANSVDDANGAKVDEEQKDEIDPSEQ